MGWKPHAGSKIFGHLITDVVKKGNCMFCGACVASCPINVLYLGENEEPVIRGPCAACQVCYYSCPRLELPLDEIEERLFGRMRRSEEEALGIMRGIYSARATIDPIWHAGQDGGTTTALLCHALDIGLVDCVVVSQFATTPSSFALAKGTPLKPVPFVAHSREELIACAGSKYTPGGTLGGLSDAAASYPTGRIALVGLPCELQGLHRMHTEPQATVKFGGSGVIGGAPILTVGLFCAKIYDYNKLVTDFIKGKHGIDPVSVSKTVIKKGRFKVYAGGNEVINVPLQELEEFGRDECNYCIDYAAELSDLSIGAIGSDEGWTTVITRTEIGEELFKSALRAKMIQSKPVERGKRGLDFLIKLANKKKAERKPFYLRRRIAVEVPIPT